MEPGVITALLKRVREGVPNALAELVALIEEDCRNRASGLLRRERPGHPLQTGDLYHEGLLKLIQGNEIAQAENSGQLFFAYSRAIRRLLVDHARQRRAVIHGGGREREPLDDLVEQVEKLSRSQVIDLNDALNALAVDFPEEARVIEMRYFGNHTLDEIAGILDLSPSTVQRRHTFATAWLRVRLGPGVTP